MGGWGLGWVGVVGGDDDGVRWERACLSLVHLVSLCWVCKVILVSHD